MNIYKKKNYQTIDRMNNEISPTFYLVGLK